MRILWVRLSTPQLIRVDAPSGQTSTANRKLSDRGVGAYGQSELGGADDGQLIGQRFGVNLGATVIESLVDRHFEPGQMAQYSPRDADVQRRMNDDGSLRSRVSP